jgi:hypothetical protein
MTEWSRIGKGGNIDLDTRAKLCVFLGEVAFGQQGFVQVVRDRTGPIDVK